jgi:hypothetical protein
MTTYDMERPAVMPTAAPVGAVTLGFRLACPHANDLGIAVKPWITGSDRSVDRFGGYMTGRSTRRLGRTST